MKYVFFVLLGALCVFLTYKLITTIIDVVKEIKNRKKGGK